MRNDHYTYKLKKRGFKEVRVFTNFNTVIGLNMSFNFLSMFK